MTDKQQPEALELADEFDWWLARGITIEPRLYDAATELRRLHAENETLNLYKNMADEYGLSIFPDIAEMTADIENLRKALQFYADSEHFIKSDGDAWDTVSGEPQNYLCDEAGTATVEDGSIARLALSGQPVQFEDDTPQSAQPGAAYGALPDVDALAQEIRRVDGGHNLGAGALAEALMPFLRASHGQAPAPINLNCKSEQKRLATLWGFVPAQAAPAAVETDPCPGCIPGGYCRTPKCGRLIAMNAAKNSAPAAVAGPALDFADAYGGAREDLAIWKRRALAAERDLRAEQETSSRLAAEINALNGPTRMGEPAAVAGPSEWCAGVEAAAKMLSKKANDFALEHGRDDMGGLSFGSGAHADAKLEYHSTLLELAEEIRSRAPTPPAQAADSVTAPAGGVARMRDASPHAESVKAASTGELLMGLAVIRELTGTQKNDLESTVDAVRAAFAPADSVTAPMTPSLTDDQIEKVYSLMNRRLFEGKRPCYAEVRAMLAAAPTTQPAPVAPGESLCNDPRLCCRSHPHEDQSQHCQLREVAAWLRWLASMGRVPSAESMLDRAEKIDSVALAIAAPAAQGDALDAARWKTFTSLPYAIRSEWVCNLSSVPVLTQWVDQARLDATRAAQEGK